MYDDAPSHYEWKLALHGRFDSFVLCDECSMVYLNNR